MFGKIFTSYPDVDCGFCVRAADSAFRSNVLSPARRKLASKIENSLFLELYTKIVRYLLSVRMRVYGVGIISFLLYTAVVSGIGYLRSRDSGSADILSVAIPALLCLATLPLLFSEISLSEALSGSLGRPAFAEPYRTRTREARYEPSARTKQYSIYYRLAFRLADLLRQSYLHCRCGGSSCHCCNSNEFSGVRCDNAFLLYAASSDPPPCRDRNAQRIFPDTQGNTRQAFLPLRSS